jgi:hypothetical protein
MVLDATEVLVSKRIQLLCAWSGPAVIIVVLTGYLIAGVLPMPLGPNDSTETVVNFYSHHTAVAAGLIIATLGLCLVFPLIALIGVYMERMEGRTPILTFLQLISGAATGVFLVMPMILMTVIAFRPDRNPEITVTLNDISWLLFLTPIGPFIIQNLAIAAAILSDRKAILPRWVGYVNIWVALSFVPDPLAFFFRTGPFAWRGILIFWLAFATYTLFLVVMGLALRQAIRDSSETEPVEPLGS